MKKNFLLLFLMALLPLAGWAETPLTPETEGLSIDVSNKGYGGTNHDVDSEIRVTLSGGEISNTYWEVEGYYETKDGAKKNNVSDLSVGATRYVKINFKGVYSGYAWGEFEVTKGVIEYTVKNDAYFTRAYRGTDPANSFTPATDVSVKLNGTGVDYNAYLNYGTVKYTTNAVADSPVGNSYTLTFSGITLKDANNYEFKDGTGNSQKFKITPAEITTIGTAFAFTHNYTAAYTYTAAEQKPTVAIAWNHDNDAETAAISLVEGTDYTVTYKVGGTAVASPTDAATYNAYITGTGNYSGEDVAVVGLDFVIGKAPLNVKTISQTKVFDGTAFNAATAQFSISGRKGTDASKSVTGLAANIAGNSENVGNYIVTVNAGAAKIGGTKDLSDNYDVTSDDEVIWKITKRPVTLTIADAEMNVGAVAFPALPAKTAEIGYDEETGNVVGTAGAVSAADKAAIEEAYTVKLLNNADETYETELAAPGTAAVGTYTDAYDATLTGADPTNYSVTVVKSKLTVKGANFTIEPQVPSDIQYGEDYTITYYAGTAEIDEDQLVFIINGTEYPYAEKDSWELPTERGSYDVTIKDGTAVGINASEGGEATLVPSAFNIVTRKLTITVNNQTVLKNDPATILSALTEGEDGVTITEDLAFDDEIEDLDLTFALDGNVVTITGGKITSDAGDYPNAILLTAIGNENYDFAVDYTKGTLTVSEDYVVDLAAATAEATITDAANNGEEYDVTISGRTLNGNKWNVMVLPFAIKPLDFCNAIGQYAVFNTLKSVEKDAEDPLKDKIYFKLELDEIPANTPFLVKPLEAVDFDTTWDDDNDDETPEVKLIVFEDVTFENAGMQPVYDAVAGATFTGNYAASYAIPSTNFWAMQGGQFNHFSEAKTLGFTRAYIELTSGAESARFFIEEPNGNGSTTAIKELNINTMESVDAEGMYNLNGMRLNGAPTQKGVYIKNGKKYLVK